MIAYLVRNQMNPSVVLAQNLNVVLLGRDDLDDVLKADRFDDLDLVRIAFHQP